MNAAYWILFISYAFVLVLKLARKQRVEKSVFAVALTVNGATLVAMPISSGYPPLFNIFESFLLAAFILGILGITLFQTNSHRDDIRIWVWVEILLLFSIVFFYPKQVTPPRHNHGELFIILFHGFRTISLAVMLFSSAHYITFLKTSPDASSGKELLHQARNFLLLGAILFLLSEYSGILWCLNGWGDFWRWNYAFLSSTFILLYLMLAFHLPGKSLLSLRIMSVIGLMSSVVVLGIMVSRSVI